jgi:hypothetical protein
LCANRLDPASRYLMLLVLAASLVRGTILGGVDLGHYLAYLSDVL